MIIRQLNKRLNQGFYRLSTVRTPYIQAFSPVKGKLTVSIYSIFCIDFAAEFVIVYLYVKYFRHNGICLKH